MSTSDLFLTFFRSHAEIVSNFPIPCPLLPLLRVSSLLEAQEYMCEPNYNAVVICLLFLQYGPHGNW